MKTTLLQASLRGVLFITACFTCSLQTFSQNAIKFGNSYINITKKTVGGTVEPGDVLEIRTNYYFPSAYNAGNIYFIRYVDNVPTNTAYVSDSLRLITNEGLTYKRYSNASADDAGTYNAAPTVGQYNVRMNIGTGAANVTTTTTLATGGGTYNVTSQRPRVGSGTLLTTAFKVQVTGAYGDTVILGAGQLLYKKTNSAIVADTIVNAIQYKILIAKNDPVCPNAVGKNFVAEAAGTFDSGTVQNRSYGPSFLIPNYSYQLLTNATQINDGFYTIVNNLSPWASTFVGAEQKNSCPTSGAGSPPSVLACANRMFGGYWAIMGDHTGAATSAGNTPKASGTRGGYMLVVNADYATSEAYRQTISGLCPNTSYEFSLWVRNVCPVCGIDSTGTSKYNIGVYPNLTFAIDNLDRYSSGQIDAATGWVKKGFLFQTGSAQTTITISIRNNASGGGGNDWAIDDIALATCNPNLDLQPSGHANVCFGNQLDMLTVVNSYFANYTNYVWEKSIDNGVSWSTTATSGVATPVYSAGQYTYTSNYPPIIGDASSNLNLYRIKVASSAANLADVNCSFTAQTLIQVFVNNCGTLLNTNLLDFYGKIGNGLAVLDWSVSSESAHTTYTIERSYDQVNFTPVSTMQGNGASEITTHYSFTDPKPVVGVCYYRIRITEAGGYHMSKMIMMSTTGFNFALNSVVNPFGDQVSFSAVTPEDGLVHLTIIDVFGKIVRESDSKVVKGLNALRLTDTRRLREGQYILRVQWKDQVISRRLIRMN